MTRRILTLMFATLVLSLTACSTVTYKLVGMDKATGADATVVVEKQDTNYLVNIEIKNLLPPQRVAETKTKYAVWFISPDLAPVKAGNLDYDDDDREGSLTATTTSKKFDLQITAEENAEVTQPGGYTVFRQSVEGK